jgi:sugar porter (SP) family MFS transporter
VQAHAIRFNNPPDPPFRCNSVSTSSHTLLQLLRSIRRNSTATLLKATAAMGAPTDGAAIYDAALQRRRALMGTSGARALLKNFIVFRIAAFACIGGVLYGYNQGMFSGVLAMPAFKEHMGAYDPFDDSASQTKKGWLTAILELGAWIGVLLSSFIAEILSRKYGILIACAVFMLGVVVQATAVQAGPSAILGGRFVTGVGVGSLSMIVPIYNSEVAPPEVRGALVALQQLAICFGIMISFWIDYGTNYIGGTERGEQSDAAWLVPICLQLIPCLVLVIGMIFMPFSPRWLVHHGREEEARDNLAKLRGLPREHELVDLEFLEIKAQSLFEKRTVAEHFPQLREPTAWNTFKLQFVAIKSLFQSKSMFRRCIVAGCTMFFQQWSGINAVLYYAPSIFKQLGQTDNTTSLLATGVVGIVMLIATIPAVLWIDKVGRKPVLIAGAIGMATCHIIIAGIFGANAGNWENKQAAGWAAITMVWLFVINFGYSWGPCAWILIAEIWPLSSRPYGVALGASSNWMNNFIIGQVTPDMLQQITYGTYIIFGILTYTGAAFIWFFVPETKRLTLEEMDVIFGSEGTAQADFERMDEISREIGLFAAVESHGQHVETVDVEKDTEKSG